MAQDTTTFLCLGRTLAKELVQLVPELQTCEDEQLGGWVDFEEVDDALQGMLKAPSAAGVAGAASAAGGAGATPGAIALDGDDDEDEKEEEELDGGGDEHAILDLDAEPDADEAGGAAAADNSS